MVYQHYPGSLNYPPLDGSLFLPELLEFNAQHNSDVTLYVYDKLNSSDLVSISHLDFYQASHRAAHKIRRGYAGADKEVVALLGNFDTLLFHTVFMGIIFAGLVPFPMSPRNSAAAVINMMEKTKCRHLITIQHSMGSLISGITMEFVSRGGQMSQLRIDEVPALKDLYPVHVSDSPTEATTPYPQISRPSKNDILLYLHSSGSTGFPKPIPITNLSAIHWCLTPVILDHINVQTPIRIGVASVPPFHTFGLCVQLLGPIASLTSVSIYRPTSFQNPLAAPILPNAQNILDSAIKTKSNAITVVPIFLQQWALSSNAVDTLKTLQYVGFGGGTLAPKMGNALVDAGVRLTSVYGATEFGILTCVLRNEVEQKLWNWVRFGQYSQIRWASQENGTYECQVLTTPTHQVSVENLQDIKGYATSDVFIKHPTVEGMWKIVGRLDDVLILSTGEKTVPTPMESIVGANRHVNGAMMFGHGRSQVGILIEPRAEYEIDVDDDTQLSELRNQVWPDIEEANKEAPAFSRIFKEMILVTSREKPMLRTGKGTVMKKATVELYEEEINALYETVESSARAGNDVPLPANWTVEAVKNWLMVHAAAANAGKTVDPEVDLFAQGFDSLSATFLRNRIIDSLRKSPDRNVQASSLCIDQNIIFSNPLLLQLAKIVTNVVLQRNSQDAADVKTDIESMIKKYSVGFAHSALGYSTTLANGHSRGDHVVVLTGSTGSLGSYMLASLLQRKDVSLIYALNRPSRDASSSIQQRQKSGFADRGLDVTLLHSEKLVYVVTNTSQDDLGLDPELYQKISTSVTVIIHNAWQLDFNLALSSFEPHVRGTRNLIDLALSSPRYPKPRFMFASSFCTAKSWDRRKGPFPEEVQCDAGVAVGLGYGASKYVCERVLVNSKLPASSFRIGQISGGPPRGAWSTSEWLPTIVKSSVSLGALPEAQGLLSWIPPHAVSSAILDVSFAEDEPPIAINLVHPRPVPYEALMRSIAEAICHHKLTRDPLPLVPFSEWFEKLESSARDMSEENIRRVPAIKLLDFIRLITRSDIVTRASGEMLSEASGFIPSCSTVVAQRVSPTVKELKPLSSADAGLWVDYWSAMGMFQ